MISLSSERLLLREHSIKDAASYAGLWNLIHLIPQAHRL